MKSVMAIGAHPDDIEFGCGGTLYKHRLQGDKVVMVIFVNPLIASDMLKCLAPSA